MNYIEALQQLVDGKRIREKSWNKGEYVYISYDDEICASVGSEINIDISDRKSMTEDRWEVCKTEAEELIQGGKCWKLHQACKGFSCHNCSIHRPNLYKECEKLSDKLGNHSLSTKLPLMSDDEVDKLYKMVKGEIK